MFPVTYYPSLKYCILVPYYDPLTEYYTNVSRSPSSRGCTYHPNHGGSEHRGGSLREASGRPDQSLHSPGAASDDGVNADAPDESLASRRTNQVAACYAAGPHGHGRSQLDRKPAQARTRLRWRPRW